MLCLVWGLIFNKRGRGGNFWHTIGLIILHLEGWKEEKKKSSFLVVEDIEGGVMNVRDEKWLKRVKSEFIGKFLDVAIEQDFVPNQIGSIIAKQATDLAK